MAWRPIHWALAGFAVVGGAALLAVIVVTHNPAPAALVIRATLDGQAAETKRRIAPFAPTGIRVVRDEVYGAAASNRLDVYRKPGSRDARPTVVWIHGGGWLAGDKADAETYFRLLADAGFTVASVNYSRSPDHRYPLPVQEVNAALGYLQANAERLHINPSEFVLAGDSAGAQLAAQVAALSTNPRYAAGLAITPALMAGELRGAILACGVYDLAAYARGDDAPGGVLGFAVSQLVWAYAGTTDPDAGVFAEMSVIDHVTAGFPPTFITGGNADPLTDAQSRPFAAKLRAAGVRVDALLFAADHEPELPHEYQFDVDTADGRAALQRTIAFVRGTA